MTAIGLSYPFKRQYNFIFEGDSITNGAGLTVPIETFAFQLVAKRAIQKKNSCNYQNLSANGATIVSMIANVNVFDALYSTDFYSNYAILLAGTNDIGTEEDEASTVHTNLSTWIAGRKATGFITIILTLTPRSYLGDPEGTQTKIDALNTLIRADKCGANLLVDLAANQYLDDPNDTTYFLDKLHITAVGCGVIADLINEVLLP